MRHLLVLSPLALTILCTGLSYSLYPPLRYLCWPLALLTAIAWRDYLQTRHAVLRNFPIIGHFRYLFEAIRPEIQQYFVENDSNGRPFNREERSVIYQRAKQALDTLPFGSRTDHYAENHEWLNHSMMPVNPPDSFPRIKMGAKPVKDPTMPPYLIFQP